jgi:hypothetical protein
MGSRRVERCERRMGIPPVEALRTRKAWCQGVLAVLCKESSSELTGVVYAGADWEILVRQLCRLWHDRCKASLRAWHICAVVVR